MKKEVNKELVLKSVAKIAADKEAVGISKEKLYSFFKV